MNVAVVGAGIAGCSVARRLAERGHEVTLFDQFPEGHTRGSSHGRSRIVRRAYPDPFYTAIMQEGYPMWAELERASGEQLVSEVGLLYFGPKGSKDLPLMIEGLASLGVPHEVLSASEISARFPVFRMQPGEYGVFTPEAGYVHADRAVAATRRLAVAAGCRMEAKRVGADDLKGFERVIVCAGAWVKDWWPEAPVRVTLQTVCYVKGDLEGPVWIEDGPHLLYGFPSGGEGSFKAGVHTHGPEFDPRKPERPVGVRHVGLVADLARRRFGIKNPVILEQVACLYTNAPNDDFLIHRADERTLVVSACSGHGFKFGPWIGKLIADVVEGSEDLARYSVFVKP